MPIVSGKLTWDIIQKIETWDDDIESQINKKVVYVFSVVEHLVKDVENMVPHMEDELKHSLMEVKRGMEELLEPTLEGNPVLFWIMKHRCALWPINNTSDP